MDLISDSLNLWEIDSLQSEVLMEMAQFETHPGCYARNLLHFLDSLEVGPYYLLPGGQLKEAEQGEFHDVVSTDSRKPLVKIYPNPAHNYFIVEFRLKEQSSIKSIRVYSSNGQIVFNSTLNAKENHILVNTSNWPGGIYYVKCSSDTGFVHADKIVVAN